MRLIVKLMNENQKLPVMNNIIHQNNKVTFFCVRSYAVQLPMLQIAFDYSEINIFDL